MASRKSAPRQTKSSDLLTRREAAEYLGVAAETLAVWHCTKRYELPVIKVGRLAKYRRSDLDKFLRNRTVDAKSQDDHSERQPVKQENVRSHSIDFAQVRLVERHQRGASDSQIRNNKEALEVVLPSGITLRLPSGASLELLSSVVALLENR